MASKLDEALQELAQSDSSIEFAPHVRLYFNTVVEEIMKLKILAGEKLLYDNIEDYFKFYFGRECD